jgi:hypothetical protein
MADLAARGALRQPGELCEAGAAWPLAMTTTGASASTLPSAASLPAVGGLLQAIDRRVSEP